MNSIKRKSSQPLLPTRAVVTNGAGYDLYPAHHIGDGQIKSGYAALAEALLQSGQPLILIDGYVGVWWEDFRQQLNTAFQALHTSVQWHNVAAAQRDEGTLNDLLFPFLGGDDPLFGKRYSGSLRDFFDPVQLQRLGATSANGLNILYGTGAFLTTSPGFKIYIDLPKNEIQYRARAGSIANLGMEHPQDARQMYKRFYFVDWVVCNRHKAEHLAHLDVILDGQSPDQPTFMGGDHFRTALTDLTQRPIRPRPWFEPGPWGGQWLKRHIPELNQDTPNYAWSFEMIAPEQGIILESDGWLLEVTFDWLMFHDARAVLGAFAARFGVEFPIRFDFLDTMGGGNLSIQCHPQLPYIREHFGETITQDETYYIVDCAPDARVFLGFQENIVPDAFRVALETSHAQSSPLDAERFVQALPARKHDLFLIPNGTVHGSGVNNLVLEISATPYIFTFKLYDWLRPDLEGRPRPLNIERAFENLDFSRKGAVVERELVAHPRLIADDDTGCVIHLPTHPQHFYDLYRLEFRDAITVETAGSVHLLMLVEGSSISVETRSGQRFRFHFAETILIPASVARYRLHSENGDLVKVIKAFLKPDAQAGDDL